MSATEKSTVWRQPGFAIVADSTVGGLPLVLAFHLTRWEAEVALADTKERVGDLSGTALAPVMASARIVPASLSFSMEPANVG